MSSHSSKSEAAHVIFVNRFYYPDERATAQLLTDLAESLAGSGHRITVITGRAPGTPRQEFRHGVAIQRVTQTHWGARNLAGRAIDLATFWITASWRLAKTVDRTDTVVALTDPPLIGVTATWISRRRGARVWHWIQDIYPEVAQALTRRRVVRAALSMLRPLRDRSWRHAEGCVTLGSDMAASIAARGIPPGKLRIIRNWAPSGIVPSDGAVLRADRKLNGKFVVMYSGNLGRVHGLDALAPVAGALRSRPDITFSIVGDGPRRTSLQRDMQAVGAQVQFFPSEPRIHLAENLAAGDLHLVMLAPGLERMVFPSKFIGALAAGRPVLFIGPAQSELARLIRREEIGHAFAPDDTQSIARTIAHLADHPEECVQMGQRAHAYSRVHATQSQSIDAWRRLLQTSADTPTAAHEPAH